ncbi:MAG: 30S ribosomal protein S14 [Pseudomonadota bacterium]|nr:30S ribosomal protein S14 [Pseudomonadota bacterium]
MARRAMEVKSRKQLKIISNQARQKTRQELKDIISSVDPKVTTEDKMHAAFKLQKRPLKESKSRYTNRCPHCGRIHGYIRRFGMCRCCVRKFFYLAVLPGVTASSW